MMKKMILGGIGAVIVSLLIISTATAVGQVQSRPVMNVLAKRESFLSELHQFMSLDKNLKTVDKEQLNKIIKIFDKKGVIDRLQNFNISEILTDDRFIDLMNSAKVQSLLTSKVVKNFFDSTSYQKIIQNQTFLTFLNSEACQNFIVQLTWKKTTSSDVDASIQSAVEPTGQPQSSDIAWLPGELFLLIILAILFGIGLILGAIVLELIVLIIGIITWPFIIFFLIGSFPIAVEVAADILRPYTDFPFLANVYAVILVFIISLIVGITWPLWGIWWYYWVNSNN